MVHKNERSPNPLEYEKQFIKLYNESSARIAKIPKRRWKMVAEPLLACINPAYMQVMGIAYDPVRGRPDYHQTKYNRVKSAVRSLLDIQGPLYVYWAVSNDKEECLMKPRSNANRESWSNEVNHTINLLLDIMRTSPCYNPDDNAPPNPIRYYTNKEVSGSLLLTSARELLLETQRQCIRLPLGVRDSSGAILCELMADVWLHALEANARVPRNKEEYIRRRDHLSALISAITKSNRALFAVYAGGTVSEKHMAKWAELLSETNDLAYRIQASDKKRFGGLK